MITTRPGTAANHLEPGTAPGHANPIRGRFNSLFFKLIAEGHADRRLRDVRSEILAPLHGDIVEIGPGNGPLFRYLGQARKVHAVEPSPYWHERLRRSAASAGIDLDVHQVTGERTGLPDQSADAVVTSWVLCTVSDPEAVLAEIRRVLKPGGRYAFIEHVAAPPGSAVRAVQDAVHRPWRWLFEGCHTNRDTASAIRAAGFRQVDVREFRIATPFVPIRTQISGVAVK